MSTLILLLVVIALNEWKHHMEVQDRTDGETSVGWFTKRPNTDRYVGEYLDYENPYRYKG